MKKFIVVGTQRTGSGLLADLVNSHPAVLCGWEWTERQGYFSKISAARCALAGDFSRLSPKHRDFMQAEYNTEIEWLGYRRLFKSSDFWLFDPRYSPGLFWDRMAAHLHWLSRSSEIHIIHIVRSDDFDWLKSKYVARETGTYHSGSYDSETKITVPIAKAIKRLKSKHSVDAALANLQYSNPYLQVEYKDCSSNRLEVCRSLCEFLSLDYQDSYFASDSVRKKQGNKSAADYIHNAEDLKNAIALL